MKLSIDTVTSTTDTPTCMFIQNVEEATQNDMHNRTEVKQDIRLCWMSW